jgi:diamine N-acetyltransferase
VVSLREIDADSVRAVCRLSVAESQARFVAPNAVSIAQAHFSEYAWFRAVYADETPVGFVMLEERPEKPEYFLWRLMIDARYQGMDFGRRAMELVIAHVRTRPGATELLTSVVQGDGSPQQFYEGLGFVLTGAYDDGEAVLRLEL